MSSPGSAERASPPAFSIASCTREPSGRLTSPGRRTAPRTWTTIRTAAVLVDGDPPGEAGGEPGWGVLAVTLPGLATATGRARSSAHPVQSSPTTTSTATTPTCARVNTGRGGRSGSSAGASEISAGGTEARRGTWSARTDRSRSPTSRLSSGSTISRRLMPGNLRTGPGDQPVIAKSVDDASRRPPDVDKSVTDQSTRGETTMPRVPGPTWTPSTALTSVTTTWLPRSRPASRSTRCCAASALSR